MGEKADPNPERYGSSRFDLIEKGPVFVILDNETGYSTITRRVQETEAGDFDISAEACSTTFSHGLEPLKLIGRIKDEGGYVYVEHPCVNKRYPYGPKSDLEDQYLVNLLEHVDGVETFNSMLMAWFYFFYVFTGRPVPPNLKARRILEQYNANAEFKVPVIAGPDIHHGHGVGRKLGMDPQFYLDEF